MKKYIFLVLLLSISNTWAEGYFGFNPDISLKEIESATKSSSLIECSSESKPAKAWKKCRNHKNESISIRLCKNKLDSSNLKIKFNFDDTSEGTCLIPTHKNNKGETMVLGSPQCANHQTGQELEGSLYTDKKEKMNGVMVMHKKSLVQFYQCSETYAKFSSPSCPYGATTNPSCAEAAQNQMKKVCSEFKQNNKFLEIKL